MKEKNSNINDNNKNKRMSLVDLTKIYDSRSFDALSRSDRASAKFRNKKDFLFNNNYLILYVIIKNQMINIKIFRISY